MSERRRSEWWSKYAFASFAGFMTGLLLFTATIFVISGAAQSDDPYEPGMFYIGKDRRGYTLWMQVPADLPHPTQQERQIDDD